VCAQSTRSSQSSFQPLSYIYVHFPAVFFKIIARSPSIPTLLILCFDMKFITLNLALPLVAATISPVQEADVGFWRGCAIRKIYSITTMEEGLRVVRGKAHFLYMTAMKYCMATD
jgi:hypothetical protein